MQVYLESALIITLVILLMLLISNLAFALEIGEERKDMQAFYETWHPGWNLGNTFDATGSETSWGNPLTTKELIDYIASADFHSIRIPVTWGHRMGPAPEYTIQKSFLNRIEQVVQWSLDAGLSVMLNVHHDTGDTGWIKNMADDPTVLPKFKALWEQISEHFKDYPHSLIFEGLNEPRFSQDWNEDKPQYFEMLEQLNTTFYQVVRSSGGNNSTRPLVLSTLTGSSTQARLNKLADTIAKLNDHNIIATVHYYGYWPFSVNIGGATRFDNQSKNDITAAVNRIYNTFVSKGIPVIIGEYGLLGFDKSYNTIQRGEVLKYFEFLSYYAKEKTVPLMLWDNGQHLNRSKLEWRDPALYKTAISSQRSANTNSDTVYFKAGAPINDAAIRINLNKNTLTAISYNNNPLKEPEEYQLNGSILTLKQEFLEKVITKEYGVNAMLELEFSAGPNWEIKIVYYDTPVLKVKQAMMNNYYIPINFNGDNLATMEAIYISGGNAGPQNWTSFKEFNYCFQPRYDMGIIQLTPAFFNEVKDQEVLLRFHFWSGEIVEYIICKSGMNITGLPKK